MEKIGIKFDLIIQREQRPILYYFIMVVFVKVEFFKWY